MTSRKQKREMTWIGKENRPRLEPRILLQDSALSCHARERVTGNDLLDNILIYGKESTFPNAERNASARPR